MGIFTGIELLFFSLGVTSVLLVLGLVKLHRTYGFEWYTWMLTVTGALLTVFTVAWSASSLLEGETQAANMGLLVFGAPVFIIFGITRRLLRKAESR